MTTVMLVTKLTVRLAVAVACWLALALVIITFAAYAPVWRAGFVWDDSFNITDNELLRTTEGLRRTWAWMKNGT